MSRALGNVNLKGKKSHTKACGCCDVYDRREKLLRKMQDDDVREASAIRDDILPENS